MVTPRRIPILAAKCPVFAALVFVISEIVVFSAFFIGCAIVAGDNVTLSLSQPNVIRALIGSGLDLSVLGLFALAIGTLIRPTAGAIATVIGLVLVIFNFNGLRGRRCPRLGYPGERGSNRRARKGSPLGRGAPGREGTLELASLRRVVRCWSYPSWSRVGFSKVHAGTMGVLAGPVA
jgi:hypothetical protein